MNNYDIENQDNIASSQVPTDGKSIASRRIDKKITLDGSLYSPLTKNIVETIVVPTPDFFTLNYDVTIWTNYVTELNTIIERIMRGYDVHDSYRITERILVCRIFRRFVVDG